MKTVKTLTAIAIILVIVICAMFAIPMVKKNFFSTPEESTPQETATATEATVEQTDGILSVEKADHDGFEEYIPEEERPVPTTEATEPTVAETTEPVVEETETAVTEAPITDPVVTEPEYLIQAVPLYNQWDYPDVFYGEREGVSVATHGDGMTTMAMIATYLLDDPALTPDKIATSMGHYDSAYGTSWTLFTDGAEELGIEGVRQEFDWNVGEIEEALKAGSLVACCMNGKPWGTAGHYVLMTGITENGKIMVNDSNGFNYEEKFMKTRFENGFEPSYIYNYAKVYWVFPPRA